MKSVLLAGALLLHTALLFAQSADDTPLAKVGKTIITRSEFLSRYELTPGLGRQSESGRDKSKAEFLFSLMAEKLLAQAAAEMGLERDSDYQESIRGIERLLVRDELYRKEIRRKIVLKEDEILDAMNKMRLELKIYFLFAPEKRSADSALALIRKGRPLESFICYGRGTISLEGPDSALAHWGSGDERMEHAVFALRPGETSDPVHLNDGYYLFKVMGKSVTFYDGEGDRKALRERAEGALRNRREQSAMFEYMAKVLKDKKASANAKIFRSVAATLFDYYKTNIRSKDSLPPFIISGDAAAAVKEIFPSLWDTVFVVFPHTTWTLGHMMDRLVISRLMIEKPTPVALRAALDQRFRDIIDQEHLTHIGYEEHLQSAGSVITDMRQWRDSFLAAFLKNRMRDTVNATPLEQDSYVSFLGTAGRSGSLVKLRKLVVDSLSTAREIQGLLKDGTAFTDLMYRYSTDDEAVRSIGKEEFALLADSTQVGKAVLRLKVGGITQPLKTPTGYLFIHLLDRKYFAVSLRDSAMQSDADVHRAVVESKLRESLNKRLGSLASKYPISINMKNFEETVVTRTPSLVYRMLGFGGRMFAMPFVDPQVRWVQYWDSKNLQLP